MSASTMVYVDPLVWPSTAGGDGRQVAWMLHGLAAELEAICGALALAKRLRDELASGEVGLLAQRLDAIASVAVPVGLDSAHLASVLEAWSPQACAHLRVAGERRREVLAAVRGWARLARQSLLDVAGPERGLARVIDGLVAAGQAVVAADEVLLACVRVPGGGQRRE
jgi:hypothetical protein